MMRPVLVTPPTAFPVTLAEARRQVRISTTAHDDLLTSLIAAATAYLDGYTGILRGRALMPQTWRQDFAGFDGCMRLPIEPVISVESVEYVDSAGDVQTLDPEGYALLTDETSSYLSLNTWPTTAARPDAVSVTFRAGYEPDLSESPVDPASGVPTPLKQAALLLISHWFLHGSVPVITGSGATVAEIPLTVGALIQPYRRVRTR